ncbi:MAG: hypothetical protein JJU24_16580 [Natronohydrobacter sp.]|nr:hypothetical protein [Natronohydrobacter sp.]
MTLLGPHLAAFLRENLPRDRRASAHTCDAYATCFQLLVVFAAGRLRKNPCELEVERGNSARSRNARLAARCCATRA